MNNPNPEVKCLARSGDEDEWRAWRRLGDPVMHIELRRWADLLLLAPLSANSLAKLAQVQRPSDMYARQY